MGFRSNRAGISVLLLLGFALGCKSIHASFTSPSDSISGTGNSISGAFGAVSDGISQSCSGTKPSPSEVALGEDVRVFTRGFATERPADAFQRELPHVVAVHGVTDWTAVPSVWHGVGAGLAQAGLDPAERDQWLDAAGVTADADRIHVAEGFEVVLR